MNKRSGLMWPFPTLATSSLDTHRLFFKSQDNRATIEHSGALWGLTTLKFLRSSMSTMPFSMPGWGKPFRGRCQWKGIQTQYMLFLSVHHWMTTHFAGLTHAQMDGDWRKAWFLPWVPSRASSVERAWGQFYFSGLSPMLNGHGCIQMWWLFSRADDLQGLLSCQSCEFAIAYDQGVSATFMRQLSILITNTEMGGGLIC